MKVSNKAIIQAARSVLPYYGRLPDAMRAEADRKEAYKAADLLINSLARAVDRHQMLPAAVASALQPLVEAAAGFTEAHARSLYSLELLKSCIMPSQLCFRVGELILTGLLQPSPALLAALLRAAATPLSLHPRLVRDAMRSQAFRSGNVAGIGSASWLLQLAHALSNSCNGARAVLQVACRAEEGSADAAAAATLPPSAAFAWLQLASDTAAQLVDHYGAEAFPLINDVLSAFLRAGDVPGLAERLGQALERQAVLVRLAAGGMTAALQRGPRPEDFRWCFLFNISTGLLSQPRLREGLLRHEQQSAGGVLQLALQFQEPLAAALAALSSMPSKTPTHATQAAGVLCSNFSLAAAALQAAVDSGDPWAQLGPTLPQLLSFLRGLHRTFGLATAVVPTAGPHLPAQHSISLPPATADSSSIAAQLWSSPPVFFAWITSISDLAAAFNTLATSPLASLHSGTLAVAADCVDALLRLAPLLPRLPRAASLTAGRAWELPAVRLEPAGALPLVRSDEFWRCCEACAPEVLAIASAELAHSLAAALLYAGEVAVEREPAALRGMELPALRACWTALKYEAAQAAAEMALQAAEDAAASEDPQAQDALEVLPTAGSLEVPTAGQHAAWEAACRAATLELDAAHDPPKAGLAGTVQRALPAPVGGAAAASKEEEKAAVAAAAGSAQHVLAFLPGMLCLSTAVGLDWLAQQLQDSEDSRKQLCIRGSESVIVCYCEALAAAAVVDCPPGHYYSMLLQMVPFLLHTPAVADLALLSCRGASRDGRPTVQAWLLQELLNLACCPENRDVRFQALHVQLEACLRCAAGRLRQCASAGLLATPDAAMDALLSCDTGIAPLPQLLAVLAALADDGSEGAAHAKAAVAELAAAEGETQQPAASEPEAPEAAGNAKAQSQQPAPTAAEAPAWPPPPTAEQLAVRRSQALAIRRCANALCRNLDGVSEAKLPAKRCSGCNAVSFCSVECSRVAWRSEHRLACAVLRREAEAAAAEGAEGDS